MVLAAVALLAVAAAPVFGQDGVPVTGACATPDSVVFRGNQRISDAMLRGDAGIAPKSAVNYRLLQRAIKNLFATGQFEDVGVTCEPGAGNRSVLVFTVRERPVLGDVNVVGVDQLSPGTVRDRVDLLVGRPVDPAQVARSVAKIDSVYEAHGYYLARVTVDTVVQNGQTKLTFRVDEGRRLAVSGIDVKGNRAVSDKAVVKGMQTKPEGFLWWKKGEFDEDKFAGDVTERIPQLYAQRGFIDMQVLRDTLVIDRAHGKALVDLTVNEGPQYKVGEFEVSGAKVFNAQQIALFYPFGDRGKTLTETMKDMLRRRGGDDDNIFNRSLWEDATRKVQTAYANEGYIYAQVRPVVERTVAGKDSVPTVNLRWEIDEQTPAIVNRVEIVGNDITNENCIRDQLLVVPGDVFNQDRLVQSYQSIANLGFFETPLPPPDTRRVNDKGDVDLIFRVKEKRTGNVNFGASVGQGTGVGGFIGFEQPNLFGMCKRGSLQWQFGRYINDFNLAYTDPRIHQSLISGTINAYHSQSRFIIRDIGRSTRTGGQLQFGFPVRGSRYTRLFVNYGGERVSYGGDGLLGTVQCNNCFRSTLGGSITRDTRFDLPFPSSGTTQSITTQFNGGPLGGSAAFQRYTAEMKSYATLATFGGGAPGSQPIKLVFGLSARMGAVFGNPGPFFVSQAFSLGGVQFGEPLRGYEEFSITPHGYVAEASQFQATRASFGNAFYTQTAELGIRFNQMLYLDGFYDAGNLWERARDFNPTRLFRGTGVGASLVTPLGPLGVDLGYGLDRVDEFGRKAPKWQVHFKFGQIF
jgi:outer membrane protein insertion porin family